MEDTKFGGKQNQVGNVYRKNRFVLISEAATSLPFPQLGTEGQTETDSNFQLLLKYALKKLRTVVNCNHLSPSLETKKVV